MTKIIPKLMSKELSMKKQVDGKKISQLQSMELHPVNHVKECKTSTILMSMMLLENLWEMTRIIMITKVSKKWKGNKRIC